MPWNECWFLENLDMFKWAELALCPGLYWQRKAVSLSITYDGSSSSKWELSARSQETKLENNGFSVLGYQSIPAWSELFCNFLEICLIYLYKKVIKEALFLVVRDRLAFKQSVTFWASYDIMESGNFNHKRDLKVLCPTVLLYRWETEIQHECVFSSWEKEKE